MVLLELKGRRYWGPSPRTRPPLRRPEDMLRCRYCANFSSCIDSLVVAHAQAPSQITRTFGLGDEVKRRLRRTAKDAIGGGISKRGYQAMRALGEHELRILFILSEAVILSHLGLAWLFSQLPVVRVRLLYVDG